MTAIDVVVVSYNSRETLRACVEPLAGEPSIQVIVVDNASPDRSLDVVRDLEVVAIKRPDNGGFSRACNVGWQAGTAPFVLFLNPDARIAPASIHDLASVLRRDVSVGIAAPRIHELDGALDCSQRRFMTVYSVWAQAFFIHRLFRAGWAEGTVRDVAKYARTGSPEWVSGACLLVRRDVLERIGGFDERFFLYCEDMDLCHRVRGLGLDVRFVPVAVAEHEGGVSAPRPSLYATLAASRIAYAQKHFGRAQAALIRAGVAVGELTHAVAGRGGSVSRTGRLRAFRVAIGAPEPWQAPR